MIESTTGHNSAFFDEGKKYMDELEKIYDEIDAAKVAIDDICTVAKSRGHDTAAMKLAIKVKMMDEKKRQAREAKHEMARAYLHAMSPQLSLF